MLHVASTGLRECSLAVGVETGSNEGEAEPPEALDCYSYIGQEWWWWSEGKGLRLPMCAGTASSLPLPWHFLCAA
jgi:hypothetical protein